VKYGFTTDGAQSRLQYELVAARTASHIPRIYQADYRPERPERSFVGDIDTKAQGLSAALILLTRRRIAPARPAWGGERSV